MGEWPSPCRRRGLAHVADRGGRRTRMVAAHMGRSSAGRLVIGPAIERRYGVRLIGTYALGTELHVAGYEPGSSPRLLLRVSGKVGWELLLSTNARL